MTTCFALSETLFLYVYFIALRDPIENSDINTKRIIYKEKKNDDPRARVSV